MKPAINGKSKGKKYFNLKHRTPKIKNKGCDIKNQDREMARRKAQIINGQLKAENGLTI